MSLYNMMHGKNTNADFLLSTLGLTQGACGRFRDCYIGEDEQTGEQRIVVYTRNGGGNREEYQGTIDNLAMHPNYVRDYDDDFDSTYASIEFSVPEKFKVAVADLYNEQDKRTPAEKWDHVLKGLESGNTTDPEVQHALEVGKKILEPIVESLNETHPPGTVHVVTVNGNVPGERGGTVQ